MALCECGCGTEAKPGKKYRQGHWAKTDTGAHNISDRTKKGASTDHGDGYLTVNDGFRKGHKLQHRVVMEGIIGRPLLDTEIVHHDDENKRNNDPSNLILCQDETAHRLIHLRKRAFQECGHSDWRKCSFCKKWDAPENLYIPPNKGTVEHRACGNAYRTNRLAGGASR